MIISDSFKDFMSSTSHINTNVDFIICDFDKILYINKSNQLENIDEPISDILKKKMQDFCYPYTDNFILNGNTMIPIYKNKNIYENISKIQQFILPIYNDRTVYGAIICMKKNKSFDANDLKYYKIIQSFSNIVLCKGGVNNEENKS